MEHWRNIMTQKEQFLQNNVGFHMEDLELIRRLELKKIINDMNLSWDWVMLALSKDSLDNWNRFGFSLFKKSDFKAEVDALERDFSKISEQEFKKENNKNNGPSIWVDEAIFRAKWNGVKLQGKIYTDAEAASLELSTYYGYNEKCYFPELDEWVKMDELPQEDWVTFCIAVQKVIMVG